jgi:hypothetical protein
LGLGAFGYLVSYALVLDRAPRHSRVLSLLPSACVVLSWALIYKYFDFGAMGSGTYHDLTREPFTFVASIFHHAPLLVVGEWFSVPVDLIHSVPRQYSLELLIASFVVLIVIVILLIPLIRRSSLARFWSLGILLSLIPVSATVPSSRLLSFVSLGSVGLIAQFVTGSFTRGLTVSTPHTFFRGFSFVLVAVRLILAPFIMPFTAHSLKSINDSMMAAIDTVPDDFRISQQSLVIVNPPDQLYYGAYILVVKTLQKKPIPRHLRLLAGGPTPMTLIRLDSTTIRVRMSDGLFVGPFGRSFRSKSFPMDRGNRIQLTGMTALIENLNNDGDPTDVTYEFSNTLDDTRLRFLRWQNGIGYIPFVPPAVGDSTLLPPSRNPFEIF